MKIINQISEIQTYKFCIIFPVTVFEKVKNENNCCSLDSCFGL